MSAFRKNSGVDSVVKVIKIKLGQLVDFIAGK